MQIFDARPPFEMLKTIDAWPITNHVNFAHNKNGTFAYVTVGGLNEVKVYRTSDFGLVSIITVGDLPHGIWPSGDGSRIYVGLESGDGLTAIDTLTNKVLTTVQIAQAPQAIAYVPGAVPVDAQAELASGSHALQTLALAGEDAHLTLVSPESRRRSDKAPTSTSLYDQGLTQVLEAAVTGLKPGVNYLLALSDRADGEGKLQSLTAFTTNASEAAVVNAVGPIRQILRPEGIAMQRYLVIVPGTTSQLGSPVQIQVP